MQSSVSMIWLRRFFTATLGLPSDIRIDGVFPLDGGLDFEDGLFDLQLRNYLKAEYGNFQPPAGAFPRLLAAIHAHEHAERPSLATRLSVAFRAIYVALTTGLARRLVSAGIAAVLLIAVLSSNSVHFLRGTAVSLVDGDAGPTPIAAANSSADLEIATNRDDRYTVRLPSAGSDPAFYDLAERRWPIRTDQSSAYNANPRWLRTNGW